jgi:hypothetical protein
LILQNGLHVHEILILKKEKVNGVLKDTYVLTNYACYNHNILIFKYEINLNIKLTQLVSNVFSTYFYNIKVVQTLYSTFNKLTALICVFIFLLQNILILLFCVHIKNCFIFKLDFGQTTFCFLFTSPCQHCFLSSHFHARSLVWVTSKKARMREWKNKRKPKSNPK